ncbi:MAG: hypothetical protein WCK52_07020 [Betaproteobacteria bacterium]
MNKKPTTISVFFLTTLSLTFLFAACSSNNTATEDGKKLGEIGCKSLKISQKYQNDLNNPALLSEIAEITVEMAKLTSLEEKYKALPKDSKESIAFGVAINNAMANCK